MKKIFLLKVALNSGLFFLRMKHIFIFFLFLFSGIFSRAQVLNVESMRFYNDSNGWIGRVNLGFSARQNVNSIYAFDNTIHVQYKKGRSRIIFLNDLDFTKANGENFENTGFQHVRYNYRLGDSTRWIAESFIQSQYNKPMKINFRGVTGAGIRFQLLAKKSIHLYVASLYMFEHEIDEGGKIYDDNRISSYFTFSVNLSDKAEVNNTIYYQPAFINFRTDYRISESLTCIFDISKHLGISSNFEMAYDTKQPPGIPNLYWNLESGLSFRF
ncbi:MAG: DUF481 domain-containing protein [Bacteroidetes bacterium]|nr:DUF481 domain-containing protein [Bacteroidota bacterium]